MVVCDWSSDVCSSDLGSLDRHDHRLGVPHPVFRHPVLPRQVDEQTADLKTRNRGAVFTAPLFPVMEEEKNQQPQPQPRASPHPHPLSLSSQSRIRMMMNRIHVQSRPQNRFFRHIIGDLLSSELIPFYALEGSRSLIFIWEGRRAKAARLSSGRQRDRKSVV